MNPYHLNEAVLSFARSLRQEGVKVNQVHSLKAMEVLKHINLLDSVEFYYALRSVFCNQWEDYQPFDRMFRSFWGEQVPYAGTEHETPNDTGDKEDRQEEDHQADVEGMGLDSSQTDGPRPTEDEDDYFVEKDFQDELEQVSRLLTYSPDETLLLKQFISSSKMDQQLLKQEWGELLLLLLQTLKKDSTSRGNNEIVLKNTIRENLSHGASELFHLYKRGKTRSEKQMVYTLVDISGSMELYLKLYLPIFYQLHHYVGRGETYLFNTQIYPVSKYFKQPYQKTLESLNDKMHALANGTNLGQSLNQLLKLQSSHFSPQLTTLIIFSDGWDRGEMDQLKRVMKKISSQVYQIIWLNPFLGTQGYQPETEALKIVKPYVKYMISLKDLQPMKTEKQLKWGVK